VTEWRLARALRPVALAAVKAPERAEPPERSPEAGDAAVTQSETVYAHLRAAILTGGLRPRESLIEADLAEDLAVSRTPIREALQRLAADGIIVRRRRGWAVRAYTPDEVRKIYEVRAILEGGAARLAAIRASDADLAALEPLSTHGHTHVHDANSQFVRVNDEFHDRVTAASGNEILVDLVRRSCRYHFNYRIAAVYSTAEVTEAMHDHMALCAALKERDPDRAEEIARVHVARALEIALAKLR
jgi:DNA-binding GntR family transcriptional regulator